MRIGFDHIYQSTSSEQVYLDLGGRGFQLDDRCVEHPGATFCRFLKLNSRDPVPMGMGYQYLEFAELRDISELRALRPEASEDELWGPGLSLNADHGLEGLHEQLCLSVPELEPATAHKNYAWKTDNKSRLPGWNFLYFKKPLLKDINLWCTEYEPSPDRPVHQGRFQHPNSAESIHAIILSEPAQNLASIAKITGSALEARFTLDDGVEVYGSDEATLPAPIVNRKKSCPVLAVSLLCSDWNAVLAHARPDEIFQWGEAKVARIDMPERGWDILLLDRPPRP